jgi:P27 family predicted phage terminase small subunit
MATAGRKPKPTALRLIEGNREHRPINANEPKPSPIAPRPPEYLTGKALSVWQELAPKLERLGILTEVDGLAFSALCIEWAEYVKLRTAEGESIQTFESGAKQVAPEVSVSHKCLTQLIKLFGEFGLTPSSRSRLSISPEDDVDDMEGLI